MKKFLIAALLAIGIFSLVGVSIVSAQGWFKGGLNLDPEQIVQRQNQMFKNRAELLGISIDQIKEYWAQGKNMQEIIEELGVNKEELGEKIEQVCQGRIQERLQILVSNRVITQEQADQRLQALGEQSEKRGFHKDFRVGRDRRFGLKKDFGR